jgi:hypothetical protein
MTHKFYQTPEGGQYYGIEILFSTYDAGIFNILLEI